MRSLYGFADEPAAVRNFREQLRRADCLLFASPEHNYNVTVSTAAYQLSADFAKHYKSHEHGNLVQRTTPQTRTKFGLKAHRVSV